MAVELKELEEGTSSLPSAQHATLLAKEPDEASEPRQQTFAEVLQIPKAMLDRNRAAIVEFLHHELTQAAGERRQMIENFARWKIVYAAPIADEPKHFPIYNASNQTSPVVKETVNVLSAQIVQTVLTSRPRFILKDLAAEWEPFTDELEEFMDTASDRDLMLDAALEQAILEATKMGTSILEVSHHVDIRSSYKYNASGKGVYKAERIKHDGPLVKKIPISKWWIRAHETDLQDARWCGVELNWTWWQLKEFAAQGKGFNLDEVKRWRMQSTGDKAEKTAQELASFVPLNHETYQVFKIRLAWDIDNDNRYEEMVIYFHWDSKTIISARFHEYWHGKRPFVKVTYFPHEDRFWGEGLCEMLEDLQAAISATGNKRADNQTLANLKMILKRKMVKGLMPGDPLYTGKVIEVQDIWNDVREFQLSEIYPSTINEEQLLRRQVERLSGSNEATSGAAMPVTRTTAAAQIALLNEQTNRIGLTVRSFRGGLGEIGEHTTHLYHQFGTNGKALAWMGERGRIVEAIFRLPRRVQELGLAIRAGAPTSRENREVKRENSIQLLNLMISVHEKLWPFAQALAPESMAEVARGMVHSANRYLSDIMESMENTDTEDMLMGLAILEKVLPRSEAVGSGMDSFTRAAEAAATVDRLTRLEGLLSEAQADRAGSNGAVARGNDSRRLAAPSGVPSRGGPGFRPGGPPTNR